MTNDKNLYNGGEEEELNITDEDIDRELADLDTDNSAEEDEVLAEGFSSDEKRKPGFLAKIKSMGRGKLIIFALIIIVVLYILIKILASGHQQNFNDIKPVTNTKTAASLNDENEKSLSAVKAANNKQSLLPTSAAVDSSLDASNDELVQPKKTNSKLNGLKTPSVSATESAVGTQDASDQVTKSQEEASATNTSSKNSAAADRNQTALLAEIKSLQNNNQQLAKQLEQVSSQLNQLGQTVGSLHGEVGQLGQQVVEIGQQKKAQNADAADSNFSASQQRAPAANINSKYYVEAVVPGRAWLEGPDNHTLTVAVGDELPGLGMVTGIDPYTGNITMSSGQTIKYGP